LEFTVNHPPATLFDQFLKERLYRGSLAADAPALPTRATLQQFLIQLRDRCIRPVTCNTSQAAMNAFCAWLHEEQHIPERVKLKKLKVERRVLELLNDAQMRALIGVKPKTFREARLHLAVLLVLDTGLRVSDGSMSWYAGAWTASDATCVT
jgi:site-specific recombinase XerD